MQVNFIYNYAPNFEQVLGEYWFDLDHLSILSSVADAMS